MNRKESYLIIVLGLIFLLFQAIIVFSNPVADYDEAIFADIGRNIRSQGLPLRSIGESGVYYLEHTPLYPYFVAAVSEIFSDNLLILRGTSLLFTFGIVVLTYLIVRQVKDKQAAFVAACLIAVNPFIAHYAFFVTMEPAMLFFIVLAIFFMGYGQQNQNPVPFWALAGGAVAVATLLKEFSLIFLTAALVYTTLIYRNSMRETLKMGGVLALPSAIAMSGWIIWAYSLSSTQFISVMNRWLNSVAGSGVGDGRLGITWTDWLQTIGREVLTWGMALILLLGVWAWLRSKKQLPPIVWLPALYFLFALLSSLLVSLKEPRHIIGIVPSAAILIGILIDWTRVFSRGKRIPVVVVILFLIWQISPIKLPPWPQVDRMQYWLEPQIAYRAVHNRTYGAALRAAGNYLAENTSVDTVITVVHEGPVIGYYANRNYKFVYTMSFDRAIKTLENTEILVVDHFVFPSMDDADKERVVKYIDSHFEVEVIIHSRGREVKVLRHTRNF